MKKKVNVKIGNNSFGVYTVKPPIVRTAMGIELTPGDIQKCLWAKAIVEEVLPDGSILPLNLNNYDKDNAPKIVNQGTIEHEVKMEVNEEFKKENIEVNVKEKQPMEEAVKVEIKDEVVVEEVKEEEKEVAEEQHNTKKKYNYKNKK